jgi:hypothetical protein
MTRERIVARLHDGLGNQLFIYAAGRAIAEARGAQLLIDTYSGFARDRKYGAIAQLQHFGIRAEIAPRELCFPPPFGRQIRDLEISVSRHLPLRHRFVVREADYDAVIRGAALRPLVRLEGYWQSPRYFAAIAKDIANELQIVSPLSAKSLEIADLISRTESVCLHVRQMQGAHHAFAGTPPAGVRQLPFSYYERAIECLVQKIGAPTFFCFADHFEWIRANWAFPFPVHFVDHNRGQQNAYEDIALMSRCRHFIIGNSTFSWWGAWLAANRDKIVIAPDNRGAVTWGSEKDLFPEGWDVLPI